MSTHHALQSLEAPTPTTRKKASALEKALREAVGARPSNLRAKLLLPGGDTALELPPNFLDLLLAAAHEQAAGRSVQVVAVDAEMTPNQAATYLGVSRPLVVKLLDEGKIPARTLPDSRHRRILVADLDAYLSRKAHRRRILAEAMNDIAEADLYLPSHENEDQG